MDRLIGTLQKKQCRVRVFVDRRKTEHQSLATSERLLAGSGRVYGPDNRIAVIVESNLAKTQSRASIDFVTRWDSLLMVLQNS